MSITAHTHFRDGLPYSADMVDHECKVHKIVYTSTEADRPIVVVLFEGRHTHPPWPEEKPTQEAKADLQKCLDAFGIYGATAEKLDNGTMSNFLLTISRLLLNISPAPSTIALLGLPLSAKHGSYHNKRSLQDGVRAGKEKKAPAGLQWSGQLNSLILFRLNS